MRSIILLLVLITTSFGSTNASAAKCKYKWDTENYRTGEKVRWTTWIMNRFYYVEDKPYGLIAGASEGDKKYLGLQIMSPEVSMRSRPTKAEIDSAMVIPKGAKLSIMLGDGTIYDLCA